MSTTLEGQTHIEPAPPGPRIIGCDVARAVAILGMILVHFSEVLAGPSWGPGFLATLLGFLDGRAAATFVVLAGVGIALRSRRALAARDPEALRRVRSGLARRGWFLLAAGFLNLAIWPGDILRVYGVSFLVAARTFGVSDRRLWALVLGFAAGFLALMGLLDYGQRWDWERLGYRGLWTASGLVRNLFYDGFRSVFPWTGFLFFGIWLGRRDLRDRRTRARLALAGGGVMLAAELLSHALVAWFSAHPSGMDRDTIVALFGTVSMPPLPLFLLASGGAAVAVIMLAIEAAERRPSGALVGALAASGQLAFTWYMAHIVLGLGTIVALGLAETQPLAVGVASGLGFFALTLPISVLWRRRWPTGPLEGLMRRVASG